MDVVLLCRVSTAGQDYSRQVDELSDFCSKMGWNVRRIFTAKVSGAKKIEERSELTEMLDYIRGNSIDKVCVLEISRLGRNTLEALKVIRLLNDNGGLPVHQELQPGDARRRRETQPHSEHDMHHTSGGGADGTPYYHGADGVGP